MIKVTFEFASVADAVDTLMVLQNTPSLPEQTVPVAPTESVEPAKRRGRPPKAQQPVDVSAPVPVAPVTAAPAEAKSQPNHRAVDSTPVAAVPSHDDVIVGQKELFEKKGAETCVSLLQRYGVMRPSELKPEQRAKYIADIKDILAGKDIAAAA